MGARRAGEIGELVLRVDCRSVGPGGTDVSMYARPDGIWCVWSNENCPYDMDDETVDPGTYAATTIRGAPGHNVSVLTWQDIRPLLSAATQWARYQPAVDAKRPTAVHDSEWTANEQDLVLSLAIASPEPDAVLAIGGLIVAAVRQGAANSKGKVV